ncbi:class I SAM-dependent methyltransferase [Bacillus marinisedimentorum]|uniref:class I SAM-dependent methyltransferase n=1 Tax=Bacillus marinisedimentorum TaxID=1821260 RepID=UPI00087227C8|nr:class I SAM-dependent methyltransferase [Bacillus marinisedimentorum]
MLERVIPFAHSLLKEALHPGDTAIDATAGNGHDTVLLAELAGPDGTVFSFDIQEEALAKTLERLKARHLDSRVRLCLDSHSNLKQHIPSEKLNEIQAAIFNLGYLPGGDKSIVTKAESTISSLSQLLDCMKAGGIIILVVYPGHPEGKTERDELLSYVKKLDQQSVSVLQYGFINQKNSPPFVLALEKRA